MRYSRSCQIPTQPRGMRAVWLVSVSALILFTGCAVAPGMTAQEASVRDAASVDNFMPASHDLRKSIETQDLFAQAAFWSHEYDLNPADLEAAIKLAAAVRKLGNPGRAYEITQTTRALHPRNPYLLAEQAAALIADERAFDALPVVDEGLKVAPGYARLWSLKGAALDQTEQYGPARQSYARALQITPNDPNILANMGLSYALAGDPRAAEQWLRQAASMPSAGAGVRRNLALVLELQGKTAEAEQQTRLSRLSRGERKFPEAPTPAFNARQSQNQAQNQVQSRTLPQNSPSQYGAQAYRAPQGPQTRLTTHGSNGQPYQSASQAARAAHNSANGAPQNPSYSNGPVQRPSPAQSNAYAAQSPMARRGPSRSRGQDARRAPQNQIRVDASASAPLATGPMTPEQQRVLDQISRSVRPQAVTPPSMSASNRAPVALPPQPTNGPSQSGNTPHIVGPSLKPSQAYAQPAQAYAQPPQSYAPPTTSAPSASAGYPSLAGGTATRRDPARERR